MLAAVLSVATAVAFVVGGGPDDLRNGRYTPPLGPEALLIEPTTTTSLDLEVSQDQINALVLSAAEVELTEEATTYSTTTTSTTTTLSTESVAAKPKPQPTTTTTTPPAANNPPAGGFNSSYESEFKSRINSLRSSNGLPALSSDGSLNARARDWAKKMGEAGKLGHSNLSSLLSQWAAVGENVGMGGSVGVVFDSLAASGGHRQNMLGDFTHVGIGVWVDGSGVLWTTHVFTR